MNENINIKKCNITVIILIMIIIIIIIIIIHTYIHTYIDAYIHTKFIVFYFIDNHNYNTTKKHFNEDSLTNIRLKLKTIDYYNSYRH